MKRTIIALLLAHLGSTVRAGEVALPYSAFGPQSATYNLIGMEWFQWQQHGDSRPRDYPIKVVVFWDQTLEETAKNHPVNQAKLRDFRYVTYAKAVGHMERTIKEFKEMELDPMPIERALSLLKKEKAE